jgi:integrase
MITDSQIKAAIKRVNAGKSRVELRDNGDRGSGRLTLVVRNFRTQVACEWYALYYRDGKRRFTKLGVYPMLGLVEARRHFRSEYAPTILAGAQPDNRFSRSQHKNAPDVSVRALFMAYIEHLKALQKGSWYQVGRILLKGDNNAAACLGADRPARSIEPQTIVSYLAAIHARGAIGMAHNTRAYISAAFAFGMKSEHSYTRQERITRWRIRANPVAAIPTDKQALRVGERFLSPTEFRLFWAWLLANRTRSASAPAVQLIMATGQRVQEILRLTDSHYDRVEWLLSWKKTKNGLPHSLPLPDIAVEILDSVVTNESGFFFPHRLDPTRHAIYTTPNKLCELYANETATERFTPRDLRRTWKTLAGRAGISKEMRDRLQNHVKKSDVSTRHYDRYDYLTERRAAIKEWNAFMERVLAGEFDTPAGKPELKRQLDQKAKQRIANPSPAEASPLEASNQV